MFYSLGALSGAVIRRSQNFVILCVWLFLTDYSGLSNITSEN